MKKIILFLFIFILVIITTITKNSTKQIEKRIYNTKENLRVLKQKYEMVLLDFHYLSSPEKLMEYQLRYFENDLKEIEIINLNKINFNENQITIEKYINYNNE
tara:strand:- start:255 stop:563 length:309 start_codon:yes stop_codon:yes gene_type:complete